MLHFRRNDLITLRIRLDRPFETADERRIIALGRSGRKDNFVGIVGAKPFGDELARPVDFAREHLGVVMERAEITCRFAAHNNQCIGVRCPFSAAARSAT